MDRAVTRPDIVYFLGESLSDNGRELRYSLRSLANVRHGRVWMVAPDIPDWVQEINWCPWEQLPEKQLDISEKYKWLTHLGGEPSNQDMADDVIVMDDDYYIVKKMRSVPLIYNMPMRAKAVTRPPQDEMGAMLRNTLRLLLERNVGVPLAAVLHVPYPITRSELPVHLEDGRGPYEWKSIWLNWAMQQGTQGKSALIDPKITEPKDVPIWLEWNMGFMSSMERTYNEVGMEEILNEYFPEKSCYER
jgi:hypothetical protein